MTSTITDQKCPDQVLACHIEEGVDFRIWIMPNPTGAYCYDGTFISTPFASPTTGRAHALIRNANNIVVSWELSFFGLSDDGEPLPEANRITVRR